MAGTPILSLLEVALTQRRTSIDCCFPAGEWSARCRWMDTLRVRAAAVLQTDLTGGPESSCSPDEVTARNKQERFVKERDGKESVYDPNYHLCPSARFNHSHILSSRRTLQSLSCAAPHARPRLHTNKTRARPKLFICFPTASQFGKKNNCH